MKILTVLFTLLFSQFLFADAANIPAAKKCIMDHAGVQPELRKCIGNAKVSEATAEDEDEKCVGNGEKDKCVVYIKCFPKDEDPVRFKVEAEVTFHSVLAKIPLVKDVMGCQLIINNATELND
jgi:hypothetical protein